MKDELVREIGAVIGHANNKLPLDQLMESNPMFQLAWNSLLDLEAEIIGKKAAALAEIDASYEDKITNAERQLRMCLRLVGAGTESEDAQ
jgi:hypothetical protein